jgi:hypothetical protein
MRNSQGSPLTILTQRGKPQEQALEPQKGTKSTNNSHEMKPRK